MNIFNSKFIPFSTLNLIKCNSNYLFFNTFLLSNFSYRFSKQNLSSRQFDIKIGQQRWKQLNNSYKALKTSFGLKVPTNTSKTYTKPDRIQYNMQSLREYSNMHPEYLRQQLKKQDSQFHEVIDFQLMNIWKADKKQAFEFTLFLINWKIYEYNDQVGQMLLRIIKKMDLTLFQIFQLTKIAIKQNFISLNYSNIPNPKTNPISQQFGSASQQDFKSSTASNQERKQDLVLNKLLSICENKILIRLQVINTHQYEALFKIINLFHLYDVHPAVKSNEKEEEPFFQIIQKNIIKNISQIPPSILVVMAVHYANNTKQNHDQRLNLLQNIQERIAFNLKFLTHQEVIAVIYSYIKTSLLSQSFVTRLVRRIQLIYSEMSWENKKNILSLSSNFPSHQKILIISQAHNELIKGKPVITKLEDGTIKKEYDPKVYLDLDYQLVPELYLASYENNLLTEQITKKMQEIILNNIYNFDHQQVVRAVWLLTVSPGEGHNLQRLHNKLESIVQGGFQGGLYTIKDVCIIVWSFCSNARNNQSIYKKEGHFWNNIEFYLEDKLSKILQLQPNAQINKNDKNQPQPQQQKSRKHHQIEKQKLIVANISYILWAYTFNRALKFKTISIITDLLLSINPGQLLEILEPFELINIITFYYSLTHQALPKFLLHQIKKLSVKSFEYLHTSMNSLELMKCLKYIIIDELQEESPKIFVKIKVWQNIMDTFQSESNQIEYEHIMGIVGIVLNSPIGRAKNKKAVSLITKLMNRKKILEQLKTFEEFK